MLGYAGQGATANNIAARRHLSEAISKAGAGNRIEAARIARQKGWL